jgi:hypothetical protein
MTTPVSAGSDAGSEWRKLLSRGVFGLSAQAISGSGSNHPHDPSDLIRCVAYCERTGRTVEHMATRSTAWARLVPEWDRLVALCRHEVETRTDGMARETYREMRRVIAGGTDCEDCNRTGCSRGCEKCKGTGRRSGGRCRPCYGSGIADYCQACRGAGYTIPTTVNPPGVMDSKGQPRERTDSQVHERVITPVVGDTQ